jgi:hypothetical protein
MHHRLTWGGGQLGNEDPRRLQYLEALRAADRHDYSRLIGFATSWCPREYLHFCVAFHARDSSASQAKTQI